MASAPEIAQSEFPYAVYAHCIAKDWFELPQQAVWQIMSEQLFFIHHAFNIRIHAFVLMQNYFRAILSTPDANISSAMRWFCRETSRSITRSAGRINQTYPANFSRCLLKTEHHYLNVYKYLYHSPVQEGFCDDVLTYPFTSLTRLVGNGKLEFPVQHDQILFHGFDETLFWLNRKPSRENWEAVRKALKKKIFALGRLNHRPHPLEIDTL